ncbi:aminodeoxychorismate synthase component I [Undibacterium sp. Ren11W]|uniref:aminodeoxychorismate synthase component I n=1 Tax=Undibacterium sp. Ren11W TaxID=3413045 RepID=UPI003BF06912
MSCIVLPSHSPSARSLTAYQPCFALLDDAHGDPSISRLYTDLVDTLMCSDAALWPDFLARTQTAVAQGLHALALFSYETGAALQAISPRQEIALPSRVFLFANCDLLDKQQVNTWLEQQSLHSDPIAGIVALEASVDQQEFCAGLAAVQSYIAAGDTYQVNFTYRLRFQAYGSAVALYRRLRERQPVPYGALICLPDGEAVLSLSPELFVRHQQGRLSARPMKGTAAASGDAGEDSRRAELLANDSKNRAENLMIVDLLRNDLGRIAVTGSVKVPHLFEVTRFSSVLQMTSSIEASLRADLGLAEIMAALFPCGSITGAPKHRTMQIIRELENAARGIYTAAIGWFDPPPEGRQVGDFCLSVPIRSLHLQKPAPDGLRQGEMGVGAGIVYDSVASEEFAECQLKARFLTGLAPQFELFETMHASRDNGCRHQPRHLQRLQNSAHYFGFAFDQNRITQTLRGFCEDLPPQGAYRLRLALQPDGQVTLQSGALQELPALVKLLVSPKPSHAEPVFLRHKTSVRQEYDQAWQEAEKHGAFDMLFCNQAGFLTEGGRSNLFICKQGQWLTPPLSDGVLPGVMRAVLLDDANMQAREQQLTLADLHAAEQIILCNSLRGTLRAEILTL